MRLLKTSQIFSLKKERKGKEKREKWKGNKKRSKRSRLSPGVAESGNWKLMVSFRAKARGVPGGGGDLSSTLGAAASEASFGPLSVCGEGDMCRGGARQTPSSLPAPLWPWDLGSCRPSARTGVAGPAARLLLRVFSGAHGLKW